MTEPRLTSRDIIELKALLKLRRETKARPVGPKGVPKLLVGPHGRVVGRVLHLDGMRLPDGHTIADDASVPVGTKIKRGKPIKCGKPTLMAILDDDGNEINRVVIDPNDPPAGLRLAKIDQGET